MNRQVPNRKYTIIGDGKVAMHFAHYFTLLSIEFNRWNRKQSTPALQQSVASSDIVLLLISDDAIQPFIDKHTCLTNNTLIHFSGSLTINNAIGCHPLMTFGRELYDFETYLSVPFVCDNIVDFYNHFPQLTNKAININKNDKAYYHALCVMAGNFTQTLMCEANKQLSDTLGMPNDILFPYLLQNTKNFIKSPDASATGPIQRKDFTTIIKHLDSLENNPLQGIYKGFIKHANLIQADTYVHRNTKKTNHTSKEVAR